MLLFLDNNLIILCTKPGFFLFGLTCSRKEGVSSDNGSGCGVSKGPGGLVLRGILGDGGGSGGGGGGGVGKWPWLSIFNKIGFGLEE